MTYEPYHQKYRPRTFADVVGQESVGTTLKNAIRDNRVANAFLFAGSRGVGKTSMARILGKALNCPNPKDGEPCDRCEMCVAVSRGEDIDVIEIDGASNRGVEEIRAIRDNVAYAPSRGRYKIYIIDEVHMLTTTAFNALLKTLEEPPPHVKFIFATTEPEALLETIVSRCQRFEFRRISKDDIVRRLQHVARIEGLTVELALLEEIAEKAEGGLRDSLSLLDQVVSFRGNSPGVEDLDRVLGRLDSHVLGAILEPAGRGDVREVLVGLDAAFESGRDPEDVLDQVTEVLREAMVREARGLPGGGEGRRSSLVSRIRESFTLDRLLLAIRLCLNTRREIRAAGQGRLQLELVMLKVARSQDLLLLADVLRGMPEPGTSNDGGASAPRKTTVSPVARRSEGTSSGTPPAPPAPPPVAPAVRSNPPAVAGPPVGGSLPPRRTTLLEPVEDDDDPSGPGEEDLLPHEPEELMGFGSPSPEVRKSGGPPPLDVIRANWGRVAEEVKRTKPRAVGSLRESIPERIEGTSITLRLPPGSEFKKTQLEGTLRRTVEDAVESVFGVRLTTSYVIPAADKVQKQPRRTRVYEDPGVRRLLDSFGGDVVSIEGPDHESGE